MSAVGTNAWGWRPWGIPFAFGMALHALTGDRSRWSHSTPALQAQDERRYPNNRFIQNAREADALVALSLLARSMPVHDRPWPFVALSGAYGRPDGALVQPHALIAMG